MLPPVLLELRRSLGSILWWLGILLALLFFVLTASTISAAGHDSRPPLPTLFVMAFGLGLVFSPPPADGRALGFPVSRPLGRRSLVHARAVASSLMALGALTAWLLLFWWFISSPTDATRDQGLLQVPVGLAWGVTLALGILGSALFGLAWEPPGASRVAVVVLAAACIGLTFWAMSLFWMLGLVAGCYGLAVWRWARSDL